MFYHVIITTKKKNTKDRSKTYSDYDITDKDYLINSILIPYIQDEKFLIEGAFLYQKDIDTLKVYNSKDNSDVIESRGRAKERESSRRSSIVFIGLTTKSGFVLSGSSEITREILIEVNSLINQKFGSNIKKEAPKRVSNKKIFIVHGHDDGMKETVARFIEKLGFDAIILHEQLNNGKTIIEKFEENTDVGFAIILYTPCDIGCKKGSSEKKPRARQNVIFEHGYFIGKLSRKRVLALHNDEVEIPSDLQGILYTPFDNQGLWKFTLAKEMKAIGFDIDMNNI